MTDFILLTFLIVVTVILSLIIAYLKSYAKRKGKNDADNASPSTTIQSGQSSSQSSSTQINREYVDEQSVEKPGGIIEKHTKRITERVTAPPGSNIQDFINTRPVQKFLE